MQVTIKPTAETLTRVQRFRKWATLNTEAMARTMARVGVFTEGEAKERAPISPTKAQGGGANANPGGLQNSITHELVGNQAVDVFVPSNGPAGDYAVKIHDERGVTWKDRGAGTIAKGPKAKEKYIKRAIDENAKEISELIAAGIAEAFEDI